jgi:hypothetical protein
MDASWTQVWTQEKRPAANREPLPSLDHQQQPPPGPHAAPPAPRAAQCPPLFIRGLARGLIALIETLWRM